MITGLLTAFFAAYELQMWWRVNRALKLGDGVPPFVWIVNIAVETSLPAIALVFLSRGVIEGPYKPLANPAVLLYFIFIILSALRLSPLVCRISGGVAAVSYLLAAAYLGWTPSLNARASMLSPERVVVGFALSFAVAGFVAGAVVAKSGNIWMLSFGKQKSRAKWNDWSMTCRSPALCSNLFYPNRDRKLLGFR